MSYQSKYTGQEIEQKLDKIGEVGVLDSVFCTMESMKVSEANITLPLKYVSGTYEVRDNKIVIKPRQRVQISVTINYGSEQEGLTTYSHIAYKVLDFTNSVQIHRYGPVSPRSDNAMYEIGHTAVCQYTNETDEECEIGICVDRVWVADTLHASSHITVTEIGRAMVVPSGYKEVELLSAPVEYSLSTNTKTTYINQDLNLLDSIFNYNALEIVTDLNMNSGYGHAKSEFMSVSSIIFNDSDAQVLNGSRFTISKTDHVATWLIGCWFKNSNTMRVYFTLSTQTSSAASAYRIRSIKGIKY